MNYYINPYIKSTERIFPMQERAEYLRLDMNEGVGGLPKDFVDSVLSEITPEFLATYPEPDRFLKKYSQFIDMPTESLMAANGTDMAIRYILETFGEPGKDVVTVTPTFEMYRINCSILGLNHVPVPYEETVNTCSSKKVSDSREGFSEKNNENVSYSDNATSKFKINIDKVCEHITDNTRIVVLLNPNNPIGDTYSEAEARRIIESAIEHNAVVLIDEAYHYFTDESLLSLLKEYDNVILMRTFSKMMSLAAVRLGVIISNPDIIHYLKNGKLTFEVNSVALLFGERLLEHPEILENLISEEKEGKAYLLNWLEENDYKYIPCKGNFVLIKTKTDPHKLTKYLEEEKKILVHDYGNNMLSDYIRISTADVESMKKVCEALM